MNTPIELPPDFNPETNLLRTVTEYGEYHESRKGAAFAAGLLADGRPEAIELAERVLAATLACQDVSETSPRFGNFTWMKEDEIVTDLNAVEFVLGRLIPMMIEDGDRLPDATAERVRASIALGVAEIARLDVIVAYTNICVLDITNSILGGVLLDDRRSLARGTMKLEQLIGFTDTNGIPFEFNAPTYYRVAWNALATLRNLVPDEVVKKRVEVFRNRIVLSSSLHLDRASGMWAGPHGRSYLPDMLGETAPYSVQFADQIDSGDFPTWAAAVIEQANDGTNTIRETANAERDYAITTHLGDGFSMGTANSAFGEQSNAFIAYTRRVEPKRPTVIFSRYLKNDLWLGGAYHETDRTNSRNLPEHGNFLGVQSGSRMIGLYSPGVLSNCASAKTIVAWFGRDTITGVHINDRRVTEFPAPLEPRDVVTVSDHATYTAVMPIRVQRLCDGAPIRIVENGDFLVLEMYNYSGPKKSFWDTQWPGGFYQGRVHTAFYTEIAPIDRYSDGGELANAVKAGTLTDDLAPPFTFIGSGSRDWTLAYERDGASIEITADIMSWRATRRAVDGVEIGFPMLSANHAAQNCDGRIDIGGASLECGKAAAWLAACPESSTYIASYHGPAPAPLTLTVPGGSVELESIAYGTVVWTDGRVEIDGHGITGEPVIRGGTLT